MSHKNKKIPNSPKVNDASKLQAHQLARCYRILVVQPKHKIALGKLRDALRKK